MGDGGRFANDLALYIAKTKARIEEKKTSCSRLSRHRMVHATWPPNGIAINWHLSLVQQCNGFSTLYIHINKYINI